MKTKKIILMLTMISVLMSLSVSAQKQQKTYDAEKFAKKVKFTLKTRFVRTWTPNELAQQYLVEKGDMSKEKVAQQIVDNILTLQKDVEEISLANFSYDINKVEVKITEESPIKIADIIMNCKAKQGEFTIILKNCVQTDISWYLGDKILFAGDGYSKAIEAAEYKGLSAEILKNNEKESKIFGLQSKDNYGKKYPGWYVTSTGEKRDGLIVFEAIEDMGDHEAPLKFTLNTDENIESIYKKDLRAYYANSRLYTPVNVDGKTIWVVNFEQGAIRMLGFPEFTEAGEIFVMDTVPDSSEKLGYRIDGHYIQTEAFWSLGYKLYKFDKPAYNDDFELFDLIAEDEDLVRKIQNKEKGFKKNLSNMAYYTDLMLIYYNKWYDEQNPGAITYYALEASYKAPAAPVELSDYQNSIIAAYDTMHLAPKVDFFANRPTEASAAVASAKPEVTVKKESFIDRLNRIKADGNKVGILVRSQNLRVNPKDFAEGIRAATIKGRYEPLEGLDILANATAEQLANGFGVDVFETVDYSQIPVKDGKYEKMDDWWSTKYKIIVIYDITPRYNAYYKTNEESGEKEFKAQMRVDSEVIVMAAEEDKPNRLKYVTASPKTWGYYNSDYFTGPSSTDFNIIQEVKKAINPPSDEEIMAELIKSQKVKVDKLIKKKSK